jgi:hypothetical protein
MELRLDFLPRIDILGKRYAPVQLIALSTVSVLRTIALLAIG